MTDGLDKPVPVPTAERRLIGLRKNRAPSDFCRRRAALVAVCLLMCGCSRWQGKPQPSIEFSKVPRAEEGGPDKIERIEGRVAGARPGQQIVLFAWSGRWWVQPLADQPFTKIQSDSRWSNSTHLGTEYAALLVEPGYRPPVNMDTLPGKGGGVVAVASVKGQPGGAEVNQTVRFSGYDWKVRRAATDRGSGVTRYDPANVWIGKDGELHLRTANNSATWTCAEVSLTSSLGYGSYVFVVRESAQLEPSMVLGMYTWDDSGADSNHRELDIEISQWGDPLSKNAQYVVQPYYVPANVARFKAPSGPLTYSFRWEPGRVSFRTVRGSSASKESRVVAERVFVSGVPIPGGEVVHLNFYIFGTAPEPPRNETEVVIEKFEYLP